MSRPVTDALHYYNQDTKDDDNLMYIEAVHGLEGYAIVHKLWKHIYGSPNGYYAPFSGINKMLFCKQNNIQLTVLDSILETCFLPEIKIFDKRMLDSQQILTSHGIQKRWTDIVTQIRRKNNKVQESYRLLTVEEIAMYNKPAETGKNDSIKVVETTSISELNGVNAGKNPEETTENESEMTGLMPQKKRKEKKGNEIKENEIKGNQVAAGKPPVDSFSDFLLKTFSKDFLPVWDSWISYKQDVHKFKYRTDEMKRGQFELLLKLSAGNQKTAAEIIKQSISQGWKGLFEITTSASIQNTSAGNSPPPVPAKLNNAAKDGINYLYCRFRENPENITISSIEAADYDILRKNDLVNFTEAAREDIKANAIDFLEQNGKEADEINVTKYSKKFGVIELFKMYSAGNKNLIFAA